MVTHHSALTLTQTSLLHLKLRPCGRQMVQHISWSQGCSTSLLISKYILRTSTPVWTVPDIEIRNWYWGYPTHAYCAQGTKCQKFNDLHRVKNHRLLAWCCKANSKSNFLSELWTLDFILFCSLCYEMLELKTTKGAQEQYLSKLKGCIKGDNWVMGLEECFWDFI